MELKKSVPKKSNKPKARKKIESLTRPLTAAVFAREMAKVIPDKDGFIPWDVDSANAAHDQFSVRLAKAGVKTRPTQLGETGCWISTRPTAANGRLNFTHKGKKLIAYRVMLATYFGKSFKGGYVHHHCHDIACFRPGTHHNTGPWDQKQHDEIHAIEDTAETTFVRQPPKKPRRAKP
jgi:hypothetical protein